MIGRGMLSDQDIEEISEHYREEQLESARAKQQAYLDRLKGALMRLSDPKPLAARSADTQELHELAARAAFAAAVLNGATLEEAEARIKSLA